MKKQFSIVRKLDDIEKELKEFGFLRIHKSFLVNAGYVQKIVPYRATLEGKMELPIPRVKFKLVRDRYFEYRSNLL
ncbi:MAG: LytTR family transcriptional regulator [Lachnospiraceae bacterium]|nr:LytTR family transcriptional regulator [Lachnospiraceae bacterium]